MSDDEQRFPIAYGDEFAEREERICKLEHDHAACENPPRWYRTPERLAQLSRDFRVRESAPEMLELLREIEADWTRSNWGPEVRALLERIDG